MLRFTLTTYIFLLSVVFSYGQCVVCDCPKTGAWGHAYNATGAPTSMTELGKKARAECEKNGGTACRIVYMSTEAGWVASIVGRHKKDGVMEQISGGYASVADAESDIAKRYKDAGGIDTGKYKIYTWYVYSNMAK
jgi:hypothetical protein